MLDPYDEATGPALGTVLEADRGSLPFALIHGESLVACAGWALGAAEVTAISASVAWSGIQDYGEPFVLHDSLCPMTPVAFIAECVRVARDEDVVAVGVRPVTDTVKTVVHGTVGATVDRTGLLSVCSPVVLPASVCAALRTAPEQSLVELVRSLRASHRVRLLAAPPEARRVSSLDDVRLLEALTERR